ncbi:monovalent cation/H(+) antiporter subunit G [candidate division KSB1 bacterium]|nr:monovalent cation/H(+) antiporter subunit G [candidate division KSB1 bacterium]
MIEWFVAILLVSGAIFMLLAAVGVLRFPDLFSRMHATTKASSFGAGLMLLSVILHVQELFIILEAMIVLIFIFLTAPVASHMIGRAAYFLQVPLWKGTIIDELHDRYNLHNHTLASESPDSATD